MYLNRRVFVMSSTKQNNKSTDRTRYEKKKKKKKKKTQQATTMPHKEWSNLCGFYNVVTLLDFSNSIPEMMNGYKYLTVFKEFKPAL